MTRSSIGARHDWIVSEGSTTTLFSRGTVGRLRIARAYYNSEVLQVFDKTINGESVTAVEVTGAGSCENLLIIYGFSSGAFGRGDLRVHCGGDSSQVIDELVLADDPARIYRLGPGGQHSCG
ncbi:MAG: hypothetical protein O3A53_05870 [Acidobacteria bacterium]|nr:hypothetical protein [Acidobacteriota bacterium]MDA1234308.1 hypothetical protein [Acidobacteriota bacterium]